jgi:hypothetical protein
VVRYRKQAIASLSRRSRPVADLAEHCGAGSSIAGVKYCAFPDAERAEQRNLTIQEYQWIAKEFFDEARAHRDAWAKLIVDDPTRADAVLAAVAAQFAGCKQDCDEAEYVQAATTQFQNLLIAILARAIGDTSPDEAAALWSDSRGFGFVYKISDDHLITALSMSSDAVWLRTFLQGNVEKR